MIYANFESMPLVLSVEDIADTLAIGRNKACGLKKWGNSFYTANLDLIKNYIIPYIGDRYVRSITTRDMDAYYTMFLEQPAVIVSGHHDTGARILLQGRSRPEASRGRQCHRRPPKAVGTTAPGAID